MYSLKHYVNEQQQTNVAICMCSLHFLTCFVIGTIVARTAKHTQCRRDKFAMSCTALEAPSRPQVAETPQVQATASACPDAAVYGATLVYFMHRLLDFREAELHALASISGISREALKQRKLPNDHDMSPLRVIAPCARKQQEEICSRAVLVKVCREYATKPLVSNWRLRK